MINWWSNWQVQVLQLLLTFVYFAPWCWCVRTAWPGDSHRTTRVKESDGRFFYCTLLMLSAQHALMLYMLSFNVEVALLWLVVNMILMNQKPSVFDGHLTMLCMRCNLYFNLMKMFCTLTKDERFAQAIVDEQPTTAFWISYIGLLRQYAIMEIQKRRATDENTRTKTNKVERTLFTFPFLFFSLMPMRSFLASVFFCLWIGITYRQEQKVIEEQQLQNQRQKAIAESIADWLEKNLTRI
jgi:hypothetical protein